MLALMINLLSKPLARSQVSGQSLISSGLSLRIVSSTSHKTMLVIQCSEGNIS